jgi:hypothetical protein
MLRKLEPGGHYVLFYDPSSGLKNRDFERAWAIPEGCEVTLCATLDVNAVKLEAR